MNSKITKEEFSSMLCGVILKGFESNVFYKEFFSDVPESQLMKERAGFDAFMMIVSLSSFYKDNPEGPDISKRFMKEYVKRLSELNFFENEAACDKFLEQRLKEYGKIGQDNQTKNYLIPLSFALGENLGDQTPGAAIGLASIFSSTVKANLEFIKDMNIYLK